MTWYSHIVTLRQTLQLLVFLCTFLRIFKVAGVEPHSWRILVPPRDKRLDILRETRQTFGYFTRNETNVWIFYEKRDKRLNILRRVNVSLYLCFNITVMSGVVRAYGSGKKLLAVPASTDPIIDRVIKRSIKSDLPSTFRELVIANKFIKCFSVAKIHT